MVYLFFRCEQCWSWYCAKAIDPVGMRPAPHCEQCRIFDHGNPVDQRMKFIHALAAPGQ